MTKTETSLPAVLIVEHDVGVRTLLGRLVSQWGCTPLLAESEDRGVRLLGEQSAVALVLSDFQPGADGETVYEHLIRRTSARPPVLCTLPSARVAPEDVELLPRPFDVSLLRRLIRQYVHGIHDSDSDSGSGHSGSGNPDSGSSDADDGAAARPTG